MAGRRRGARDRSSGATANFWSIEKNERQVLYLFHCFESLRRVAVPFYLLHVVVALALVGGITVMAGVGSYSRMLWKASSYNSLRREQDSLKQQYQQLQTQVQDTNQRLNSLQSLA